MGTMERREKMKPNLSDILKSIDKRETRYYHSVLDPEAKVITEEGPDGIKLHVRPDVWRDFVSNTWLSPEQVKKIGSHRVDYNKNNYCARCVLKYPKTVYRCSQCKNRLRTKPWHGRSNFTNGGRY
jgi:hypothetical protein